jgi:folate-binding protein YgfZ
VRKGCGLFRLSDRGLIAVRGGDRVRWLDGMVSNDVSVLRPNSERSGCYATLLTRTGRIVADLHVLARDDDFWLETLAAIVPTALEYFERHLIADDVDLQDISSSVERFALEGPSAQSVLERAMGTGISTALEAEGWAEISLAGISVVVARYGWSGEMAFQLLVPSGSGEEITRSLEAAGSKLGLMSNDRSVLEVLRIEAGIPMMGAELGDTVLPAEAQLDRAVSRSKGCYVGQEVVARMETAGRTSHRLVGLAVDETPLLELGVKLTTDSATAGIGEVTSSCWSATSGPIALGFVRSAHAEPGTDLMAAGRRVRVVSLPFSDSGARL